MVRWLCVALPLVIACKKDPSTPTVPAEVLDRPPGSSGPTGTTTGGGEPVATRLPATTPSSSPPALAPEAACDRFSQLLAEDCYFAKRFPVEFREKAMCIRSLENWFSDATPQHEQMKKTVACWALDCDAAASCMVSLKSQATPAAPRACGEEGTSPIFVDKATWEKRRGAGAKRFSDLSTSVAEPVEVCGVEGEVELMTLLTCKGGSHPYTSQDEANSSRDSWMDRGGKCNSILDRYTVPCPEATYTVHVDRYVCPMAVN